MIDPVSANCAGSAAKRLAGKRWMPVAQSDAVGIAGDLDLHHARAAAQAEIARGRGVGRHRRHREQAVAGLAALGLEIGAEARAASQHVVDELLGDEGAAALLDTQQPLLGERRHRAANGVAVDGKPRRQRRLGRQAPLGKASLRHLARQRLGDLAPAGDALCRLEHAHRFSRWCGKALYKPAPLCHC